MWCNLSGAVYVVKLFSAPMTPGLKSEGAERWPERRRGDVRMNMATHALGTTRVVASGDTGEGRSERHHAPMYPDGMAAACLYDQDPRRSSRLQRVP